MVYTQIQETVNEKEKTAFALLNASHCQNIKALLKNLIQSITRPGQGAEEDDLTDARQPGGPKFLNYDLQILHDWYRSNDITRCVVTFPDSEALGTTILTDVLSLLQYEPDLSRLRNSRPSDETKLVAGPHSFYPHLRGGQLCGFVQQQATTQHPEIDTRQNLSSTESG